MGEVVNGACGRRQVEYAVERPADIGVCGDVMLDELEGRVADQMSDVIGVAGDEIVESNHRMAICQKAIGEM
jgi:hypothetical protein